ncbi:hypothetical protein Ancab_022772 [Ancistrocladus abbreviatus]
MALTTLSGVSCGLEIRHYTENFQGFTVLHSGRKSAFVKRVVGRGIRGFGVSNGGEAYSIENPNGSPIYSYKLLSGRVSSASLSGFMLIWDRRIPLKVGAFLWKALHFRLPTRVNLLRMGILKESESVVCARCASALEDENHFNG